MLSHSLSNAISDSTKATRLIIFDAQVDDLEVLLQGLQPDAVAQVLDPSRDGVEQITAILQQQPTASLTLVAHGFPGGLQLGNTTLELSTLPHYAEMLQTWFAGDHADLTLLSCRVAAGDAGAEFVEHLQQLTRTAVTASTQPQGQGSWLPVATHLFTPQTLVTYTGRLDDANLDADINPEGNFDSFDHDEKFYKDFYHPFPFPIYSDTHDDEPGEDKQLAPTVLTQDVTLKLDLYGKATLAAAQVDNGSYDQDGTIASYNLDKTSFTAANLGPNTVTLTVKDNDDQTNSATAQVTVLDELAPIVAALTPSRQTLLADSVGMRTFELTVDFFEPMNTSVTPTLTFPNEDPSAAIQLDIQHILLPPKLFWLDDGRSEPLYGGGSYYGGIQSITGKWIDADTYVATYNVLNTSTPLTGVDVGISGAKDIAGNLQKSTVILDVFNIGKPVIEKPVVDNVIEKPAAGSVVFSLNFSLAVTGKTSQTLITLELGGLQVGSCFDEGFYLKQNQDVAKAVKAGIFASGYDHFAAFGFKEGRSPIAYFDEQFYLSNNADVKAAVDKNLFASGIEHFLLFGHKENRDPSALFDADDYLLKNPDVAAAVKAGTFDSAFEHLLQFGAIEGRLSYSLFQEDDYLAAYGDVKVAIEKGLFESGWEHFQSFGMKEGRNPSDLFDNAAYLAANADVAAAVKAGTIDSGVQHFFLFGYSEGRSIG